MVTKLAFDFEAVRPCAHWYLACDGTYVGTRVCVRELEKYFELPSITWDFCATITLSDRPAKSRLPVRVWWSGLTARIGISPIDGRAVAWLGYYESLQVSEAFDISQDHKWVRRRLYVEIDYWYEP